MDGPEIDPERRRQVPTLLWFILAAVGLAAFAAVVMLIGGPSPLGVSDNANPAAVESQSPVAPGIARD